MARRTLQSNKAAIDIRFNAISERTEDRLPEPLEEALR